MVSKGFRVERTILIQVPPERVLNAFFDPRDLGKWWRAVRSVTVPRPLGTYALEWHSTDYQDEVLGRLGGAFHGTVMDYRSGEEFFVADAYWSPPDSDPIGPSALEVTCVPIDAGRHTQLTVRHSAEDGGPRWQRYFEVVAAGWQLALSDLKQYLESDTLKDT
jgi:uncharacterized protein YndB with AHSA1/START domain